MIAFLIGLLLPVYAREAFTHHLPAMTSLFPAFCLSILAAGSLLACQELVGRMIARPPLRGRERGALSVVYAGLVLLIFLIATQARQLQDVGPDEREPAAWIFAKQILQPLTR